MNKDNKGFSFSCEVESTEENKAAIDKLFEDSKKAQDEKRQRIVAMLMKSAELQVNDYIAQGAGISENLTQGNIVELKGIGNIGFSCSGAWTKTADEQNGIDHKIGVTFFPSHEVAAAVASAKTAWTKDNSGDEPSDTPSTPPSTDNGGVLE